MANEIEKAPPVLNIHYGMISIGHSESYCILKQTFIVRLSYIKKVLFVKTHFLTKQFKILFKRKIILSKSWTNKICSVCQSIDKKLLLIMFWILFQISGVNITVC